MAEQVLVVMSDSFSNYSLDINYNDGVFFPESGTEDAGLIDDFFAMMTKEHSFIPRHDAEEDESYKQIIPYVLVRIKGTNRYFVYRRLSTSGESRLHGKISIGVGGHINDTDFDGETARTLLDIAATREILEETNLQVIGYTSADIMENLRPVGLIQLAKTPVDRVHLGVLYILELDEKNQDAFDINESCLEKIGWYTPNDLRHMQTTGENLEGWTDAVMMALLLTSRQGV